MATNLTRQFIQNAQRDSFSVEFRGRTITLAATYERAPGPLGYLAELQVMEGTSILGYITPYGDDEHGAVKVQLFGVGAPAVFRTLDGALAEILN